MSKNTVVRGMLVPSLKNKPLDGRMDVPTLDDIVNIENPYVNFIFPVAETGMWYKVTRLTDKVIDELVIPDGEIAEYETFGEGMTDKQKEDYLLKSIAEQMYLKKDDAALEYLKKTDADEDFLKKVQAELEYLKKEDAEGLYQPKGDYLLKTDADGTFATKEELEDLENRIGEGGGGEGGNFIDAPKDGKTYGRKDGLWKELVDAPSDGKAYARINGVWAPIESGNALDPMLPVLSLTIGSSIENDATIAKVAALVSYADKEFMLGNGGKMNVPYGLDVTVTFPNVDNYSTPDAVVFEDVQSDIAAEGTYINLQEVVNVYVSADDGSSVDGQVLTVGIVSFHQHISNGVYIEDTDGVIHTKEQWDGSKTVNSIVLISDGLKVRTYSSMRYQSGIISGKDTAVPLEEEQALKDMDGETNTSTKATYTPYSTAQNYTWPNGTVGGYIPALGELNEFYQHWDEYVELRTLIGLSLNDNGDATMMSSTASTEPIPSSNNYYNWGINLLSGNIVYGNEGVYFIFSKITEDTPVKKYKTEEYEVLGGQVSFGALQGDEISIKASAKGDEYRTPDEVHLTVQDGDNNVSLVYNLLVIDTIYINNLIADTSSIISGEMNGKAVQAIWNNVHRYLGKIVTKEDSTKELVLLDIDQNDNRYYSDGSMIDLEALGTNAYFFTKIPAVSYKITQMSDNIYKVQISYKNKPEGDGWKHFDELIVPTFGSTRNESGQTNVGLPVYFNPTDNNYRLASNKLYIDGVNAYDYSYLVLLCYAKYGVDNELESIETEDLGLFVSSSNIYYRNGRSLQNGIKDIKFRMTIESGEAFVYSILGCENMINAISQMTYYNNINSARGGFVMKQLDSSKNPAQSVEYVPQTGVLTILDRENEETKTINITRLASGQYVKSLIIEDYFYAFPKELGTTSGMYYNSQINASSTSESNPHGMEMIKMVGSYVYDRTYCSRVKVVCPHRIESDREAFESLTNIWK